MRIPIAGLLALGLLSGCSMFQPEGYPLSSTVRDCMKNKARFLDAWGCVQTRYASGQMGEDPDRRVTAFLKMGDDLAGQVAARTMTDSVAKARLADGSADLDKM